MNELHIGSIMVGYGERYSEREDLNKPSSYHEVLGDLDGYLRNFIRTSPASSVRSVERFERVRLERNDLNRSSQEYREDRSRSRERYSKRELSPEYSPRREEGFQRQKSLSPPAKRNRRSNELAPGSKSKWMSPQGERLHGCMFGNLRPLAWDPAVDPPPHVCYNCWKKGHNGGSCTEPAIMHCCNCGRRGITTRACPRCSEAYEEWLSLKDRVARGELSGGTTKSPEGEKVVTDLASKALKKRGRRGGKKVKKFLAEKLAKEAKEANGSEKVRDTSAFDAAPSTSFADIDGSPMTRFTTNNATNTSFTTSRPRLEEPIHQEREEPYYRDREEIFNRDREEIFNRDRAELSFQSREGPHYQDREEQRYQGREELRYQDREELHYQNREDLRYQDREEPRFQDREEPRFQDREEPRFQDREEPRYEDREMFSRDRSEPRYQNRDDQLSQGREEPDSLSPGDGSVQGWLQLLRELREYSPSTRQRVMNLVLARQEERLRKN